MTTEEKAKAYDEAVCKMKEIITMDNTLTIPREIGEYLFPELKESDEKIKKKLIHLVKESHEQGGYALHKWEADEMLAWLEKQGKQNPCESCEEPRLNCQNFPCERKKNFDSANKVKPKFKVGDWIIGRATNNEPRQISEITDQYYKSTYGGQYGFSFENEMHLWTIQDAKDGDVLAYPDGSITMFNYMTENLYMAHVLWVDGHIEFNNSCAASNVHPATKEQCDLLFAKMKEAGYEWDAEKKELEKIEQKPADWSEEDETRLTNIIIMLKEGASHHFIKDDITKAVDWLKSLRPQNHWKPTEEQVEAFEHFVRSIGESGYASPYENNTKLLYSLLNDLEKLIE